METYNVNFQLKGIELLDINLKHPQVQLSEERTYDFNVNIQHLINHEEKRVVVNTTVEAIHREGQSAHAFIKTKCVFFIENFSDFIVENTNEVNFPQQFIVTLNTIALSTTRGIMYCHFKGTFMHDVLLPIVDPMDFVPKKA